MVSPFAAERYASICDFAKALCEVRPVEEKAGATVFCRNIAKCLLGVYASPMKQQPRA